MFELIERAKALADSDMFRLIRMAASIDTPMNRLIERTTADTRQKQAIIRNTTYGSNQS